VVNIQELRDEILNDPLNLGYAQYLPSSPGWVVSLLNAPNLLLVKEKYVTVRTLLAQLGVLGAIIAEKLSQFGNDDTVYEEQEVQGLKLATKWAMKFIDSDGQGLDLGHVNTQTMIDGLLDISVLTSTEAAALKNLAMQSSSRAEQLFGVNTQVTLAQVAEALNGNV